MVNTKHRLKSANLYDPIARVCSWKSKSVRALMARRLLLGVTELSCPKVANTHPGPPSWKTTDMPGVVCRESGGDFRRNGRCSESQGAPQGESMPSIFSLPRGSLVPLLGSADVQSFQVLFFTASCWPRSSDLSIVRVSWSNWCIILSLNLSERWSWVGTGLSFG